MIASPTSLRERQANLIASLPRDPQRAGVPLDIGNTKPCYVAGPKTESRQEHDDRAIASTFRRPAVTGGDQAVDLLCREIFRQIGQAPRGERRHGLIQVGSAPAMDAEIPHESP
jgi:hypothetical protein